MTVYSDVKSVTHVAQLRHKHFT